MGAPGKSKTFRCDVDVQSWHDRLEVGSTPSRGIARRHNRVPPVTEQGAQLKKNGFSRALPKVGALIGVDLHVSAAADRKNFTCERHTQLRCVTHVESHYLVSRWLFVSLLGLGLSACSGRQSVLNPAGADAEALADLFWVMLTGATLIAAALTSFFIYVTRIRPQSLSRRAAEALIICGGVLFPVVVLAALLIWTLPLMPAHRAPGDGLTVQVKGEKWWWRVVYRTEDGREVVSSNEIRLPNGRRTDFVLEASHVIHSFWIPALGGKTDMIPGRTTYMSLEPEKVGIYRGQCAEYCGESHAFMAFETVVMEQDEFASWLDAEARDAVEVTGAAALRGRAIFEAEGCAACHTVRGTGAVGTVGPDLTHIATRQTLAAGGLPISKDAIVQWIVEPGSVKPGARMPGYAHLSPDELEDLAIYLMGLE